MNKPTKYAPKILIWEPPYKETSEGYLHVWVGIRCFTYAYISSNLADFVKWGRRVLDEHHPGKFKSYVDAPLGLFEPLYHLGLHAYPVPKEWIVE